MTSWSNRHASDVASAMDEFEHLDSRFVLHVWLHWAHGHRGERCAKPPWPSRGLVISARSVRNDRHGSRPGFGETSRQIPPRAFLLPLLVEETSKRTPHDVPSPGRTRRLLDSGHRVQTEKRLCRVVGPCFDRVGVRSLSDTEQ
jgi:hypothetical protein